MTSLSRLMKDLTARHPVMPSILSFGLIFPGANLVQQVMLKKNDNYKSAISGINWSEVGRFMVYGSLIHGPVIHNWILFSTRIFPLSTVSHILGKVVMDQVILVPCILTAFFTSHSMMEGRTREEAVAQWKAKFVPTWATGASVWPFLIAFCHRCVPLNLRTRYLAVCSFFWFIFLAHLKNRPEPWKPPLLRLLKY